MIFKKPCPQGAGFGFYRCILAGTVILAFKKPFPQQEKALLSPV